MSIFRKVITKDESTEGENSGTSQGNYNKRVDELRTACKEFGDYLKKVNEKTRFSDIIEKFKDENKCFGKQMKKKLSKFQGKPFDPQKIGDYLKCFEFKRETPKNGYIKRSAIDDKEVYDFFNRNVKDDSIFSILEIKKEIYELNQNAKTVLGQADTSLAASGSTLDGATVVQNEIEQALARILARIEENQKIGKKYETGDIDVLNDEDKNKILQQCMTALNNKNEKFQQCVDTLNEQKNILQKCIAALNNKNEKLQKMITDLGNKHTEIKNKDEFYGGKWGSLNALCGAIDVNNSAANKLKDEISNTRTTIDKVEEDVKKAVREESEKLSQVAKEAFTQASKSVVASGKTLAETENIQKKIEQTLARVKENQEIEQKVQKVQEESIKLLGGQVEELKQDKSELQQATQNLEEQQKQTGKVMSNRNSTCEEKIKSLSDLRKNTLYNDEAIDALDYEVKEAKDVNDKAQENIERAKINLFDSKTGTFTIKTEADFEKIKYFKHDIKNVVVEKGVTTIKEKAFYFYNSLESIELGNVKIIGEGAFYRCSSLASVSLGNITIIGDEAFSGCTELASINLGNVQTIGENAFSYCRRLKNVNLGNVTTIEDEAFFCCSSLASVELGNVQTIGYSAFSGTALKSIDLKNVKTIKNYAFSGCTLLASIDLGNFQTIKEGVFNGCSSLASIELGNVKTIKNYAFSGCSSLASIELGNVKTIKNYAFSGCTSLASINLGNVKTIGESAFKGCTALGSLGIINLGNVQTIGESAFKGCRRLASIDLGDVQTIGNWAFSDCVGLRTVTLPKNEKAAKFKVGICMDTGKTAGDGETSNTIKFF